ncbi:MAG: hypothetical protein EZS28_030826, partial [Streblomastix strix]
GKEYQSEEDDQDYDDEGDQDELEPEFEQLQENIHFTLSSDILPDNERKEKIRQQFEEFEKTRAFSINMFIDRRLCNDFLKKKQQKMQELIKNAGWNSFLDFKRVEFYKR